MVDGQQLAVGVRDRELLPAQLERPDLRVVDAGRAAALRAHVVPRPELAEALAAHRELADELVQPRVVDVGTDLRAQACDGAGGRGLPVAAVQVVDPLVEEAGSHQVRAGRVVRHQRRGQRVRGQDVHVAADDVRGRGVPAGDELADADGHLLGPRRRPPPGALRPGQGVEVGRGVLVQLQRPRQRLQDLLGRVLVAALLEPHVVVGAHAGEQGDLLASQPGHPAPAARAGEQDVLGPHELAPRPQVLADRVLAGHDHSLERRRPADPGPATPRVRGPVVPPAVWPKSGAHDRHHRTLAHHHPVRLRVDRRGGRRGNRPRRPPGRSSPAPRPASASRPPGRSPRPAPRSRWPSATPPPASGSPPRSARAPATPPSGWAGSTSRTRPASRPSRRPGTARCTS